MFKLLHNLNLYERFNRLVNEESKKIFLHTVYTLSICTAGILFVWYVGIVNMNAKNSNTFLAAFNTQPALETKTANSPDKPIQEKNISVKVPETTGEIKKTGQAPVTYENKQAGNPVDNHVPENNAANTEQTKNVTKPDVPDIKKAGGSLAAEQEKILKNPEKDYGKVQKAIYMGAKEKTQVAVTFDDGYNQKMIEKVLDVLKKYNIKCTFFIIGSVLDDYPQVWKRAIDEGHQICNHTNYHKTLTDMSDENVKDAIIGWETSAKKSLGEEYVIKMKKEFPYLRLPGGGGNKSGRILSIAQAYGYRVIGWSIETNSSIINPLKNTTTVKDIADKIEQHVMKQCSNGSIILFHFNQYDTENIDSIVQGIDKLGFEMKLVSEIIK